MRVGLGLAGTNWRRRGPITPPPPITYEDLITTEGDTLVTTEGDTVQARTA